MWVLSSAGSLSLRSWWYFTDSEWADGKVTRWSATGMVVKLGEHLLCFSSRLQRSVALSSGEAELSAQVGGLTDALGIKHLLRECGMNLSVRNCCDSSAARGLLTRLGTGKQRHLELKHLWVQEVVARKEVAIHWISQQRSPADVWTHQFSLTEFRRCLRQLELEFRPDSLGEYLSEGGCWNAPTSKGAGQLAHGGALSNPATLEGSAMNQCVSANPELFEGAACATLWKSPIPMAMTTSS